MPVRVKKTRQDLKPFAGVGEAYAHREQAEAEGQHDDIKHENAPVRRLRGEGLLAVVGW
jgi:hypothetical protein